MDDRRLAHLARYLEKHLARKPARLGLSADAAGWVKVADLLETCRRRHFRLDRQELEYVAAHTRKKRLFLSPDGLLVRARARRRPWIGRSASCA